MSSEAPYLLVVEDNPTDVRLLQEACLEHGLDWRQVWLKDGEAALDWLETTQNERVVLPSLIVLDLNLPKRDGMEVLVAIRQVPAFSSVPVVFLTSSGSPRDQHRAAALGANGYLRKPVDLDEFLGIGAKLRTFVGLPNPG